ncbi:hypothetical protein [Bowmanella denitrificans]|uniref:hypothetical protein n=1 Tax=Bowmanella denitrificans TaxID=366582 RepID=UPI000C9C301D|nr:hypothetical protein [Bowmanella denitrificans]
MIKFGIAIFTLLFCAVACASVLEQVQSELNVGEDAHENEEFNLDLAKCKNGLKLLGSPNAYYTKVGIDDTGLKLTLAEVAERQGNVERASNITCRVLKDRIELTKRKVSEE